MAEHPVELIFRRERFFAQQQQQRQQQQQQQPQREICTSSKFWTMNAQTNSTVAGGQSKAKPGSILISAKLLASTSKQGWIRFISNSSCVFFDLIAAVVAVVVVAAGATPFQIMMISMQGTQQSKHTWKRRVPPSRALRPSIFLVSHYFRKIVPSSSFKLSCDFENVTTCSKRTLKTTVETQL